MSTAGRRAAAMSATVAAPAALTTTDAEASSGHRSSTRPWQRTGEGACPPGGAMSPTTSQDHSGVAAAARSMSGRHSPSEPPTTSTRCGGVAVRSGGGSRS